MEATLYPSVTSWQAERDGLLDHISWLSDSLERASDYLVEIGKLETITPFDILEALTIIWEAKDISEERRARSLPAEYGTVEVATKKEDQQ